MEIVICIVPLLLLAETYWLYKLLSHRKELKTEMAGLDDELTMCKLEAAERENNIREKIRQTDLTRWLKSIPNEKYSNEIEVETKFIYPLVKYLGYTSSDFNLRRVVKLKMGREETSAEADWVIWTNSHPRKAFLIIEAKSPTQSLDETVIGQARSYAFGLNAPYYLVTNSKQLLLYKRGVEEDSRIIGCDAEKYPDVWPTIYDSIGRASHAVVDNSHQSEELSDDEPEDVDGKILSLVRKGKKIDAIKYYRRETGAGLKDAKEYVESLMD